MTTSRLDAGRLLAAAEAETGLGEYGDPGFRDRFAHAVDLLRKAGMDEAGERAAAGVCRWLLSDRLRFFDDHPRYGLETEAIVRPLFATGEPRSGTTLLHALLSVDPDARAMRFWEVMYPSPPPGLAAPDDPRRARADADWREINRQMPEWLTCHPYNDMLGEGLPECERTWAFDFRVMTPTAWWRVPTGMVTSGLPSDARAQLRIHKMMLQHIQRGRPQKFWALKGFHGPRLAELFELYPDARIIWTHRDPVQLIASRIKMAGCVTQGLTGKVDWAELATIHLAASRASIQATLANPWVRDPRIQHVRYADFVREPIGTIREFYAFAARPWTDGAERAMRDYLARNRSDRHGRLVYSTDLIGADVAALHEEFAPYRARFDIEIEKRG